MNRKYRKRKIPRYFFIISLALFLFVGIGYSVINSNLTMQGNVVRKATSWSIGFSNPVFDTGSKTSPTPTITNGTTMTMNVNLTNPGDIYAFTVDLTNNGSVPALINTLNITELTEEQKVYLRWKVEYEDESPLKVGDLLKAGETKKVHIYLEYKKLRATDLYPSDNVNLNLTVQANFYLPEETFNTVTITKNGSTKLVQVSNLIQEATLDDFPIESTDIVVACNNGVEPSTDENNKIVLSKVKQDATCRIESSLANAVTNSETEVTNMAFINDSTYDNRITFENKQNINLDFNGKTYNVVTQGDIGSLTIDNGAYLLIKDTKGTGRFISNYKNINVNPEGNLVIKSGIFERKNNNDSAGGVILTAGETNILGGQYIADRTWTIYICNSNNKNIYINNATIETYKEYAFVIYLNSMNNNINISNTIIKANNPMGIPIYYNNDSSNTVFLCNNTIKGNTYDFSAKSLDSKVKTYYYNNVFTNNSNLPVLTNNINSKNVIQSDIACAE